MPLPINQAPVYTLEIPSTKEKFKYRPFLVKEEKTLLIAQQSENLVTMFNTLKDLIRSCAKSEIDVDKLALFDIEYIFLKIRSVSVGEIVELIFSCDEDHGEDNDKAKVTIPVNLDEAEVVFPKGHESRFILFDDVGIQMKYPTLDTIKKIEKESMKNDVENTISTALDCIDYIYDSNEIYSAKDTPAQELLKFIENLSGSQFAKIQNFFDTLPTLSKKVDYNCPVCNKAHSYVIEGLDSFF